MNNAEVVMEVKAVSYTRDSRGKTVNKHFKDTMNTIHQSTGSGGNTDCLVAEPVIIDDTFGYESENRVYSEYSPTIRSERSGLKVAEPSEDWQTVVGNKQLNPFRGSIEGTSPCITSACGAGGGMTPMLTDADLETTKTKEFIEQVRGHEEMRYRIRKLTPRECFRLMGVDDADIDKIQASGISNSQQYKCAGNSIVVDVLYHLFRKLYIHKGCEQENFQQTLF